MEPAISPIRSLSEHAKSTLPTTTDLLHCLLQVPLTYSPSLRGFIWEKWRDESPVTRPTEGENVPAAWELKAKLILEIKLGRKVSITQSVRRERATRSTFSRVPPKYLLLDEEQPTPAAISDKFHELEFWGERF